MKNPAADFRLTDEELDNLVDTLRNESNRWNANGNYLRGQTVQWCIDRLSDARMDANKRKVDKLMKRIKKNRQLGI